MHFFERLHICSITLHALCHWCLKSYGMWQLLQDNTAGALTRTAFSHMAQIFSKSISAHDIAYTGAPEEFQIFAMRVRTDLHILRHCTKMISWPCLPPSAKCQPKFCTFTC